MRILDPTRQESKVDNVTTSVAPQDSGPTIHVLNAAEVIIHEVVFTYGSTQEGENVITVPKLPGTITLVVAGVLTKDLEQQFRTANVLIWYVCKALHGLGIRVAPAGIELLHERLGGLLHGDGQPMRPPADKEA